MPESESMPNNYRHISQFTEQTKEQANLDDNLPVPPSYLLNATVEDDIDHEYQLPPPPEG